MVPLSAYHRHTAYAVKWCIIAHVERYTNGQFSSYVANMPQAMKLSHHLIQGGNRLKNRH